MRIARSARAIPAALLLAAAGCILPLGEGARTGRPLGRADAPRGAGTTKLELVERLGPPMAIAGPGERVEVPAATVHHVDELGRGRRGSRWFGGGSWTQQGDAWLELFAARRPLRESHRVWYWYSTWDSGFFWWLVVGGVHRRYGESELWVLVDEETGLVEDAVFRER